MKYTFIVLFYSIFWRFFHFDNFVHSKLFISSMQTFKTLLLLYINRFIINNNNSKGTREKSRIFRCENHQDWTGWIVDSGSWQRQATFTGRQPGWILLWICKKKKKYTKLMMEDKRRPQMKWMRFEGEKSVKETIINILFGRKF